MLTNSPSSLKLYMCHVVHSIAGYPYMTLPVIIDFLTHFIWKTANMTSRNSTQCFIWLVLWSLVQFLRTETQNNPLTNHIVNWPIKLFLPNMYMATRNQK